MPRPAATSPQTHRSLKHFFISPFSLNHLPSCPPKTPWLACYRWAIGGPMATQKQIHANRSPAQLSSGPRAEPGNAISRRHAPKTGIDAKYHAASGEDPAALTATHGHEFQPIAVVERLLVDILIVTGRNSSSRSERFFSD